MDEWNVVAEPVGANPGLKPAAAKRLGRTRAEKDDAKADKANVGGVIIYLTNGRIKEEVTRVGFIRKESANPKDGFKKKLDEMVQVAREAADTLNGLNPDGPLQ